MTNYDILKEYEAHQTPVPSYEEWKAKLEENAQLKELLEECSPYIGHSAASRMIKNSVGHKKDMKLLTKIDEALR